MSKIRQAIIKRKTSETDINGRLVLDGSGKTSIATGLGFLDHMLTLFAFHGLLDLTLKAVGDLKVDSHHTNEDIAICLGKAFKEALGDCKGIARYGAAAVPMDQTSARVLIDISGRYAFKWKLDACVGGEGAEAYSLSEGKDFFDTFAKNACINLHVLVRDGEDVHHTLEAAFKAFGIALSRATANDPRRKGVPSTKGIIDL